MIVFSFYSISRSLREKIQPSSRPVTLPHEICTECFERLVSKILQGDKMLHFLEFICIFILIPLTKG